LGVEAGTPSSGPLRLHQLGRCFEGAVPAIVATASAAGVPNITYLSAVRLVDDDHVALSNQFFSKTTRNLVENPRASVMVIDPVNYDEYRLTLVYERTERHGPVFEQLRHDVDVAAAHQGMQDVFRLRAADLYRVVTVEQLTTAPLPDEVDLRRAAERHDQLPPMDRLAELTGRLSRCTDLDALVGTTVDGLAELLGYEHCLLLLLDETGTRLFTIASHGYSAEGVGSEVVVGEGIIGMAAARAIPIRIGNLRQMAKYSRSVRRAFEDHGDLEPGRDIAVPGLPLAESRVAVPAVALGQVVGVLVVESTEQVAFDDADEAVMAIVAAAVANAIEVARGLEGVAEPVLRTSGAPPGGAPDEVPATRVRFFAADGSTFVDGEYLIKGVAGRILWSLLRHHRDEGRTEFTNKEVRLDPTLELPELRDNLESRLILLKRRLEERDVPIRIEKTGRGRFRLVIRRPVVLDVVDRGLE
jgi:adenylate cyclase